MASNLTWNGTVLPMPTVDGVTLERPEVQGRQARMWNGALRADYVAEKAAISIAWVDLTATEYTLLANTYDARKTTASTLVIPDGRSFSVLPKYGSWTEAQFYTGAGNPLYSVQLIFLEV